MDDKYRGAPLRTTPEARERADKTLRNIYGTRVKIPPPGAEREELIQFMVGAVIDAQEEFNFDYLVAEKLLQALEEELG